MATLSYIALVAVAAVLSTLALVPALAVLALAIGLAFRHELRLSAAALPHSLILRG